jgi:hypothetical protein
VKASHRTGGAVPRIRMGVPRTKLPSIERDTWQRRGARGAAARWIAATRRASAAHRTGYRAASGAPSGTLRAMPHRRGFRGGASHVENGGIVPARAKSNEPRPMSADISAGVRPRPDPRWRWPHRGDGGRHPTSPATARVGSRRGSGRAVQAGAAADWSEACERRAFQAALAHNPRLSSRGTITCSAVSWNRPRARPGQSFCLLIGVALGGGHWTDTGLSNETDVWESKRFPVAAATLKRRAPAVYAWMFR